MCNHVSLLDMYLLFVEIQPSFVAKDAVQNLPIIGVIAKTLNCIFASHARGSGTASKGASQIILSREKSSKSNSSFLCTEMILILLSKFNQKNILRFLFFLRALPQMENI